MYFPLWAKRLLSPRDLYAISQHWVFWLGLIAPVLIFLAFVWGLFIAPQDYRQGDSYRIIFIHVPAASIALVAYCLAALAGGMFIVWRIKVAAMFIKAVAVPGAAMTLVALVSGSFWARPTWGTWWVWDARVTSMLILLLLYGGVIMLYEAFDDSDRGARAAAIIALISVVNVPIIYKSVDWWFSLHQGASITFSNTSIDSAMLYPLLFAMFVFYVFFAWVTLINLRLEIARQELFTRWLEERHTND